MTPIPIKLDGQTIVKILFAKAQDGEVYFLSVNELTTEVIQLCKAITIQS